LAGEAFGTFVLAIVLFSMLDPKNPFAPSLKTFALIIGLVVGFIIMVEAPLTMSGINPARDLGPRIATAILGWGSVAFPGVGVSWWIWTAGPIIGAIAGGAVAIWMSNSLLARPEPPVASATPASIEDLAYERHDPGALASDSGSGARPAPSR
jgi:glycerol uptake facilitator protein